jgi:hypothetical protein
MASSPIFVGTPKSWYGKLSAANTNRDGTGTTVSIVGGGSLGSRVDKIKAVASGTVTAGIIRYYITNGSTTILLKEVLVPATTPSITVAAWEDERTFSDGLLIQNGWSLLASTNNAEGFNVIASGGDY